jgi:hypothetical protein
MTLARSDRGSSHDEQKHAYSRGIFQEKLDLEKSEEGKSENNSIEKNKGEKKKAELEEERKKAADKKKREDVIKKLWNAIEQNSFEEAIAIVEGHPDILSHMDEVEATKSDKPLFPHFLIFLVKLLNQIKKNKKIETGPLRAFILRHLSSPSVNNTILLATENGNNNALHLAACGKEYEICEAILKAAVRQETDDPKKKGRVVQQLIYFRAKLRGTPLEDIRAHFSPEQVKALHALTYTSTHLDLNQHDPENGETGLIKRIKQCSSPNEEEEVLSLLDQYGVNISFYESDYEGNTALHFAILEGRFEIAEKILECMNQFGQSHRVLSARNSTEQMPHQVLIELGIWLSLKKMDIAVLKENEEEKKEEENEDTHSHDLIPSWICLCEKMINNFGEDGILSGEPKQNLSSFKEIVGRYYKEDFLKVDPVERLGVLKQLYESYLLLYPSIKEEINESIGLLAFEVLKCYWTIDPPIDEQIYPRLHKVYKTIQKKVPSFSSSDVFDLSGHVMHEFDKVAKIAIEQLEDSKIKEQLDSAFKAADFALTSLPQPSSQECHEAYSAIASFFQVLKEEEEIQDETKKEIIAYIMKNIVAEIAQKRLRTKKQLQACEQGLKEILIGTPYISKNLQMAINTLFAILAIGAGVGLAVGYIAVSPISVAVLVGSAGISFGLFCVRKYSDNNDEIKYHEALGQDYKVKEKLFKVFDGEWEGVVKQTIKL